MSSTKVPVRRALISVYDKTGLEELARGLHEAGVEVVSTGSTAERIRSFGLPVTAVEAVTGFPEILGGRVKTLHPHVHAGLLADQNDDDHVATIERLGIAPFQLVISNLYPFAETVASGASSAEIIEQIDIGGPSMVRASAKNHGSVAVVVNPSSYPEVLAAVKAGGFDLATRRRLALAAFRHTAAYDVAVATWMGSELAPDDIVDGQSTGFPAWTATTYERTSVLRYGENPHQQAALYAAPDRKGGLANAQQLQGKEMSYNNYVDGDAAMRAAYDFAEPCVAIIKHANPCGIAIGADIAEAHRKANACDPISAFGGVIAANRPVTLAMAEQIKDVFTEVVVAPAFDDDALECLKRKKNLRLLIAQPHPTNLGLGLRPITGGLLIQTVDLVDAPGDDPASWELVAGKKVDKATLEDLAFAWRAVRSVKSNAILLAHELASIGIGMGQVNRVDSAKLAVTRAGERAAKSVAAGDAFFPFADGLQVLIDAGVRAVVQPGGSLNDDEVIEAAKKAGITMYFTGVRHFAH